MSKITDHERNELFEYLDHLHRQYPEDHGYVFRHISMRLNDGAGLFDRSLADEMHIEWHSIRKVNLPENPIYWKKLGANV